MRPFEWLIAVVLGAMAWQWLRGRRAGLGLAGVGLVLVILSVVFEGQRAVMWPAYLVVTVALLRGLGGPAAPRAGAGVVRMAGRVVGVLLVLVATVGLPMVWPVIRLPKPTGPHPIGTAWLVVRDSTRHERFSTKPAAMREFPVKIWYPATADAKGPLAPYAEPEETNALGMIPPILTAQTRLARTHSMLGVPVAPGSWPVVIFSHGYTGYAAQNTPQMEELASRGYVVASIAHTGEASWTPFPGGRGVPLDTAIMNMMKGMAAQARKAGGDPKKAQDSAMALLAVADPVARKANFRAFLQQSPEPLRSQSVMQWALDTKALLDVLGNLQAGSAESPFRGKLDLQHVGVFGMSYGGATAGEFCRLDHRCRAAINIDGGQYGGLVDDSLRVPLLIIGSEQAIAVHVPVLDLVRAPAYLLKVPATNHVGLTDMSLQGPLFAWIGMTGRLDPARRESIMTDYVVGFFEKYLMGRSPELFDGLAARYPEVEVTKRNHP